MNLDSIIHNEKSVAILYFTRNAQSESIYKNLASNNQEKNRQLTRALIDHTRKTIINSGIPFYQSDFQDNRLTFGQNLVNNLDQVFSKGYDSILILGNDCPDLTTKELQFAASELQQGRDTYGRSTDGGMYLIGLQQESFHRKIFCQLPWQSEALAEAFDTYLYTYSREVHSISLIIKSDIDDAKDLFDYLASPLTDKTQIFYKVAMRVLYPRTALRSTIFQISYTQVSIECPQHRGPPTLAA